MSFDLRFRRVVSAAALAATAAVTWPVDAQHARPAATRAAVADGISLPLDGYLARLRTALRAETSPLRSPQKFAATVTAESRFRRPAAAIRDFQVLSDSERTIAGYNLGAGSWDTEVGVLGSAVATEFLYQAARAGVSLDAVDVVFTSHQDPPGTGPANRVNYPRNLSYTAYLVSSATDAQLEALKAAVDCTSPVLNFVREAQDIPHGRVVHTPSPATPAADAVPGLRDFLVEKRAALLRRQQQAEAGSAAAPATLRAHVRVEDGTGIREIRTGTSNFQILHDGPRALAGFDLGPTPEEHQLGVMITCLTHIFEIQAAQRQVVLDGLELSVEGTLTPRGPDDASAPRLRDVRYTVHITSPATSQEIDALRQAVESVCPIYNLLKDPQTITGRIVRARYEPPVVATSASR